MKFGERIGVALAEIGWKNSDLARASGVADATIGALINRGSDRTNYKEELIRAFPADKISHQWLRDETGAMTPSTEAADLDMPAFSRKAAPEPQVDETLEQLEKHLERADQKTRDAVAELLLRYAQNPAKKLAAAIAVLLSHNDDSRPK